ncbi:hypothetical protein CQ476_18 [TM7 phage DolZOral124_53_65]|nr:hypothetical protein CQ476_18 [TM7 phage DolZOral124_53_65]
MSEFQLRDIVSPIRKYTNRDGEEKTEYIKIGTARVSEHGSQIQLFIKSTPLNWNGTAYANKPYEKKQQDGPLSQTDALAKSGVYDENTVDKTQTIDLSEIPF